MSRASRNTNAYEDYTQLFIGPNSLAAPLWESVYLDRKHCF
ncbi:molecular chaperone TorD family protein [Bacillus atrophaeus]